MTELPEITSAEDMLTLLREAPTRRLVMMVEGGEDGENVYEDYYAVCEHETEAQDYDPAKDKLTQIAIVADGSDAKDMLNRAFEYDVDEKGDPQPIKYGPWCSYWSLPEYHKARGEE